MPTEARLAFDGSPGSYVSTPDLNLLDADTAHIQQSLGKWSGSSRNVVTQSTEQKIFGDYSLRFESVGTADQAALSFFGPTGTAGFPCSELTEYTMSLWIYLPSGYPTARIRIRSYNAAGTSLGNLYQGFQTLAVEGWVQLSHTFTTAATAEYVGVYAVDVSADGGLSVVPLGVVAYAGKLCLREGSDATFVPSLRIMETTAAELSLSQPDVAAPATSENWMYRIPAVANDRYQLYRSSGGNLVWSLFGAFHQWAYPAGAVDGVRSTFRFALNPAGSSEMFVDDVSAGTTGGSYTPTYSSDGDFIVGRDDAGNAGLAADIFGAYLADGSEAAKVAVLDPTDLVVVQ